ncbi:universal stress protein [Halomicrobium salinisoli]|uniref:universal stress protein n=1 Tax=Halomicrobium salinisoli TaxID=2878391 RepID=UPI001CF0D4B1|nr:universal stress protein [Halomicrobium salinisoli]
MYTILMPVDADETRALAQAETVRELPGIESATVHVMHVFGSQDRAESTSPRQLDSGRTVSERLQDDGVRVETLSRYGDPSEEILRAADEIDADMIVLGGRKRSPLGSVLFGSVSQEVTLDASRPVTITGGLEDQGRATHRCPDCGEEYYAVPGSDIGKCRACGGSKVEPVA